MSNKYIILVGDGMADWPIEELNNKTILETANIPTMDKLASIGKMGIFSTVPESMAPGSEVANMAIMGYRPEKDLTGRGPLEALSAGVKMNKTDIAFRCNLINIQDSLIKDYSSGHITTPEAIELIKEIQKKLGNKNYNFYPGIQYRHIFKIDGKEFSSDVICTPPHDQLDKPYKDFLVKPKDENNNTAKKTAELMNELIEKSNQILKEHPINKKRIEQGKLPATHVWFWSGGHKPHIKSFQEKYGLSGAVISAVDLIFGLGIAAGLKPIHVQGATGLLDTNFEGKVEAAINSLKEKDFVYLHVEAPDEMGHAGDIDKKIKAVEEFDKRIVKPIVEAERIFGNKLAIAILPDHPTPIKIRTHAREPVPVIFYHPWVDGTLKDDLEEKDKTNNTKDMKNSQKNSRRYNEKEAQLAFKNELGHFKNGEQFMTEFINRKD